jgi:hypothetical protein
VAVSPRKRYSLFAGTLIRIDRIPQSPRIPRSFTFPAANGDSQASNLLFKLCRRDWLLRDTAAPSIRRHGLNLSKTAELNRLRTPRTIAQAPFGGLPPAVSTHRQEQGRLPPMEANILGISGLQLESLTMLPSMGRPAIDHTTLSGSFSFHANFFNLEKGPPPDELKRSMPEQLGLKLEAKKAPLETRDARHRSRG